MLELLSQPWPWYVAGPLIGLVVPLLLWVGGEFGVSENLRHICAAVLPTRNDFFRIRGGDRGAQAAVAGISAPLAEDRAVRCPGEWDRMAKAWQRLLAEYRP